MKAHGPGPCPICDNTGDILPEDIPHIMERLMEDGYVEETEPGMYRLIASKLPEVLKHLEEASKEQSS